jgi:hypothetical protein
MSESNSGNGNNDNFVSPYNAYRDLHDRFRSILIRVTNKMLANGARSARTLIDRAKELKDFIATANPDTPFDVFSAEELGAELYDEVRNILREAINLIPRRDRYVLKMFAVNIFQSAVLTHHRNHPGNMQNDGVTEENWIEAADIMDDLSADPSGGGRRRKSRRAGRKQRKTRRSRR